MTTKTSLKLHDKKAFIAGTLIGGPIAASLYFYDNLKAQGSKRTAKLFLLLGPVMLVGLTVLGIVLDTLPRAVFGAISLGIVIALYMQFQDKKIDQHIKAGGKLHGARTVAIALISMVVTIALFFGYIKVVIAVTDADITVWEAIGLAQDYDRKTYNQKMAEFTKNDEQADGLLNVAATTPTQEILDTLDDGIALYKKNQLLLNDVAAINGLPSALEKDTNRLRKYVELRIQLFELIKKAVAEDTTKYDSEIEATIEQIKPYLEKK